MGVQKGFVSFKEVVSETSGSKTAEKKSAGLMKTFFIILFSEMFDKIYFINPMQLDTFLLALKLSESCKLFQPSNIKTNNALLLSKNDFIKATISFLAHKILEKRENF